MSKPIYIYIYKSKPKQTANKPDNTKGNVTILYPCLVGNILILTALVCHFCHSNCKIWKRISIACDGYLLI